MNVKTKSVPPRPEITAARDAVANVLKVHAEKLTAIELLALLAHMVGQTIALQDQRTVTPEMAMEIVCCNIEQGNMEVLAQVKGEPVGHA